MSKNIFSKFSFDKEVKAFLDIIEAKGYQLTLVGGACRDIIEGKDPKDLDFQITKAELLKGEAWEKELSQMCHELSEEHGIDLEELPYGIFRFKINEYEVEISSARLEVYNKDGVDHHNFTAHLISNLNHKDAFKRRDFTIGAIGVDIDGNPFDPYNGLADLKNKELRQINDDCFRDPVRLLRAIRFKVRNGFQFHSSFERKLALFDLSQLTHYYFWYEAKKSGHIGAFLKELNRIIVEHRILFPKAFKVFDTLPSSAFLLKDKESFIYSLVINAINNFEEDDIDCVYFEFSKKTIAKMKNLLKDFSKLNIDFEAYKILNDDFILIKDQEMESLLIPLSHLLKDFELIHQLDDLDLLDKTKTDFYYKVSDLFGRTKLDVEAVPSEIPASKYSLFKLYKALKSYK